MIPGQYLDVPWRITGGYLGLLAYSWFSDGAPMAASPTLRPIPGGRQVPEEEGGRGRMGGLVGGKERMGGSKGETLDAYCYNVYVQFMNRLGTALA